MAGTAILERIKKNFRNTLRARRGRICLLLAAICTAVSAAGMLSGCADGDTEEQVVYIYNWGDYIDPETIEMFEEETGISVVYDEFDTNESMYPRVAAGAARYDLICPSDYMIQKMVQNDLLQPLDYSLLPTVTEYVDERFFRLSEFFDPGNVYSVPYSWGTLGIMYNTAMVDEPVDSWSILWDEKYRDNILMQDSVRDAFAVALKMLGYSLNTTDHKELEEARDLLISQKPIVQAYVVDEVRDKMASGEAALAVIFSGEALMLTFENEDLDYAVPKEGTNIWFDSFVIPKNAENVEEAHAFIDFMCRPEIALMNFEYITYPSPVTCIREMEKDPAYSESPIAFPDPDDYADPEAFEAYQYLGKEMDSYLGSLWIQVKSY